MIGQFEIYAEDMPRFLHVLTVLLIALAASSASAEPLDWNRLKGMVSEAQPVAGSPPIPLQVDGPVVVTFFASWCPPCTDEFAHLNSLTESEALGNAAIVGINMFENFGGKPDPARMARFLDNTKPRFPLLVGTEEMRVAFGELDRIPTVIVFDASGMETWRFVHARGAEKTHVTFEELAVVLERMH